MKKGVFLIIVSCLLLKKEASAASLQPEIIKISSNKTWVADTLFPSLEGDFFGGWTSNYRIEYEATKFTLAYPCSVFAIFHGVYAPISGIAKQCSVFLWNDASGSPGEVLFSAQVTIVADSANRVVLNVYSINPALYISGPFWVGNYEMDTLFPTSVIDSVPGNSKYYSGGSWIADEADYVQGAFVKYNDIGKEEQHIESAGLTLKTIPNLFSRNTFISYSVKGNNKDVTIGIYDITGALVKQLVSGKHNSGNYTTCWDGCNGMNNPVGSGIYFCRLVSGDKKVINKMILVR